MEYGIHVLVNGDIGSGAARGDSGNLDASHLYESRCIIWQKSGIVIIGPQPCQRHLFDKIRNVSIHM